MAVKGVIAAGHAATAQAGADILAAGGGAVDAMIAAAFAACVAEPALTGLGGGGFMLAHDAKTGQQTLLDFFVSMPGRELNDRVTSELVPTPIDFGNTVQMFHGGHAAIGVPGMVAGLCEAHRRYGTLPLRELVAPAKQLAKDGVEQTVQQEYLIQILQPVLSLSPDSEKLFRHQGELLKAGDRFYHPDVIGTLDAIAADGAETFYRGDLAQLIIADMEEHGGRVTRQDLAGYQVMERVPVEATYREATIISNPPPSSGGALIAHTLKLLEKWPLREFGFGSLDHLRHLVEAFASTNTVRSLRFDEHIHDEDVLEKVLADEFVEEDHQKISNRLGNTTHISVMDNEGNAVSMTSSNGAGSGIATPGTGILFNNILGEEDLNPQGFFQHPVGERMTSMMAPTIVLEKGKPRLAVGSAGSNRIRSAVTQVICNILDFAMPLEAAVKAPRLHCEGDLVELEGGTDPQVAAKLAAAGYQTNLWKEPNLFFGGVQAVSRKGSALQGAGDHRRGGVAVTVPE